MKTCHNTLTHVHLNKQKCEFCTEILSLSSFCVHFRATMLIHASVNTIVHAKSFGNNTLIEASWKELPKELKPSDFFGRYSAMLTREQKKFRKDLIVKVWQIFGISSIPYECISDLSFRKWYKSLTSEIWKKNVHEKLLDTFNIFVILASFVLENNFDDVNKRCQSLYIEGKKNEREWEEIQYLLCMCNSFTSWISRHHVNSG